LAAPGVTEKANAESESAAAAVISEIDFMFVSDKRVASTQDGATHPKLRL
jgi:hypothetical protein